ncbi:hypothetical protein [Methylobacter sp.]|jgi:hypothetical protein|nr:hypothetical protein [Methylobacter sp.]
MPHQNLTGTNGQFSIGFNKEIGFTIITERAIRIGFIENRAI